MCNEDKIREAAYFVWLNNGCPEGADVECWLEAEACADGECCCECVCECTETKAEEKKPAKKAPAKKAAAPKAEKAEKAVKKAPAKKAAAKK